MKNNFSFSNSAFYPLENFLPILSYLKLLSANFVVVLECVNVFSISQLVISYCQFLGMNPHPHILRLDIYKSTP